MPTLDIKNTLGEKHYRISERQVNGRSPKMVAASNQIVVPEKVTNTVGQPSQIEIKGICISSMEMQG
jgi:hypothetical protein